MRHCIIIFLIVFNLKFPSYGQDDQLFKIVENNKIGYINNKGEIKIQPVFLSGGEFSEGLAAVRKNGLYGYINQSGDFIINPQYDLASDFVNGMAVIYKNGEPLFINTMGKQLFDSVYNRFTFLSKEKGIIRTKSGKHGVISLITKELLVDTLYSSISDFKKGVAIVERFTKKRKRDNKKQIAVIDTTGKYIVPFGKFEEIKPYIDGYAVVEIYDPKNKDGNTDGVIDTKGNLLFKYPYKNNCYMDGDFHDGFAKISLYKYWIPEKKGITSTSEKNYEGFINLKGELALNDTNYRYVNDFSNKRAFVKANNGDYFIIDTKFNVLSKNTYKNVLNDKFQNNYAIVQTENGWGIIDTSEHFVIKPQYEKIDEVGIIDSLFYFSNYLGNDKYHYGVANLNNTVIIKPIIEEFDKQGFINGLLKTIIDDKITFINRAGTIVWQANEDTTTSLKEMNVDFMNRGYFYAYSSPKNSAEDNSGGWATSKNKPQKIKAQSLFKKNELSITIDVSQVDTFAYTFYGYNLFISNLTTDTIKFNAQDSRLYVKLQAQNENGEWKDIEYLPNSWCGNSYHKIELESNAYWSFKIPKYFGEFSTKIRAELKYIDPRNSEKEKVLYSNIIDGRINPGQFWNKRAYHPRGLMDPYFE